MGFSKGHIALDDSGAVDDLNSRDSVAEPWLLSSLGVSLRKE